MSNEEYFQYHNTIKSNTILVKDFDVPVISSQSQIQVLCIVRNGEYYLNDFIKHHKKINVSAFTFIDNGSEDNTVKLASTYPNVRIFKNELPYKTYWHHFKRFMFEEYGQGCWNLVLDIDEFFEYPFQDQLNLKDIIEYNNQANFTAVVTHMVDLVPNHDILSKNNNQDFTNKHVYYSTDNLKLEAYEKISPNNMVSNPLINFHLHGWRDKTFSVGEIMLTKHCLIKGDGKLKYVHDHFVENAAIADFTCLLKHYKFAGDFKSYVENSIEEENHFDNSREYKKYYDKIDKQNELNFYEENMLNINNKETLFANLLIIVSPFFLIYFDDKIDNNQLKKYFLKQWQQADENKNAELKKLRSYHKDYPRLKTEIKNIKNSYTWKIARFFTKSIGFLLGKR